MEADSMTSIDNIPIDKLTKFIIDNNTELGNYIKSLQDKNELLKEECIKRGNIIAVSLLGWKSYYYNNKIVFCPNGEFAKNLLPKEDENTYVNRALSDLLIKPVLKTNDSLTREVSTSYAIDSRNNMKYLLKDYIF